MRMKGATVFRLLCIAALWIIICIAVSVVFSYVVFGEKLSAKAFFGLLIFILGTMLMLL